jgi:hypothetical protein
MRPSIGPLPNGRGTASAAAKSVAMMRTGGGGREAIARVNTPVPAAVSRTSRGPIAASRAARSRA